MATSNVPGYKQVYKPTSYTFILKVWLDVMKKNMSFSKSLIEKNSSLRNMFVEYTLIKFHFRIAKRFLCPFIYTN